MKNDTTFVRMRSGDHLGEWRLLNKVLPTSDRLSRRGLVDAVRNCPLCGICRETVEHMFFHCREIKAAYAFWFVLANKCMSPTGTVPAITKLTCADMVIGMKEQPRSATTNTLASMLLYSTWITRNKTVHREGLCDREGTVAIRIQLYFYSYLKSCIKLDYQVAKIKNKLTDFRKFWAGLCQISDSNSLHFLF